MKRRVTLHNSGLLIWEGAVLNKRGWTWLTVEEGAEANADDASRIDLSTTGRMISLRTLRLEQRDEYGTTPDRAKGYGRPLTPPSLSLAVGSRRSTAPSGVVGGRNKTWSSTRSAKRGGGL